MHPYIYCGMINSGQDTETTEVSSSRWLHKEDVAQSAMGYCSMVFDRGPLIAVWSRSFTGPYPWGSSIHTTNILS